MRKSFNLFSFLFISFFCNIQLVHAQKKDAGILFGGNIILGFPAGDFSDGYTYASGLEGFIGYGFAEKAYLVGTLGYVSYKAEDTNPYGNIKFTPMKAGIRFYPGKSLFVAGNAGVGFLKDASMTSKETRFIYDVGVGIHFSIIHIGFYYDGWKRKNTSGTTNSFQGKIGIAFK